MKKDQLLDIIKLKNGKTLCGIIDYVTTKQLFFLDFTTESEIDYLLLAIMWKGSNNNMRFSVYVTIHYPTVKLPQAKLIPINNITSTNRPLVKIKSPKQRRKVIKFLTR